MTSQRVECEGLPKGWLFESVVRKSGQSAGKSDAYYFSPSGQKCRTKAQIAQLLPEGYCMDNLDFKTGKLVASSNQNAAGQKRKRPDANFGRDFQISHPYLKSKRQMKKSKDISNVVVFRSQDLTRIEGEEKQPAIAPRGSLADIEAKKRRAEILSQRMARPKQLFWQKRLQSIKASSSKTEENCEIVKLQNIVKDLFPGSNDQAMLNSIAYSLFNKNKIQGQQMAPNDLRKNPGVWCNPEQPFCAPFTVSDDMMRAQEKKVQGARKRLAEAQEILKDLQDDDVDDADE